MRIVPPTTPRSTNQRKINYKCNWIPTTTKKVYTKTCKRFRSEVLHVEKAHFENESLAQNQDTMFSELHAYFNLVCYFKCVKKLFTNVLLGLIVFECTFSVTITDFPFIFLCLEYGQANSLGF